jgi:peptidoglycan/LPS O-acetylase OafA/YrhL
VGLLGAFWLSLALGARPWIEPVLANHPVRSIVNWFSQRSLTVYLWHGVVLYACLEIPLPGGETWVGKLAWCLVLLPVITLVVGWAEDVAARRPLQLWPRLRRTAAVSTAIDAGTAAGTDATAPSSGPAELDLRDAVPEPGREPS